MKKCISLRAAGTCSMLLRGFALSCRVLRLKKVVFVSSSNFYVINFAIDRDQVTETAVENHLEGSHSISFRQQHFVLKGFGGELAKVLASIDCCKYVALQHAISCRVEQGLRRMNRTYCRLDKKKYRPDNNPLLERFKNFPP